MSSPDADHPRPANASGALLSTNSPRGENESFKMGQSLSTPGKDALQPSTMNSSQTKTMSSSRTSTASTTQTGSMASMQRSTVFYSETSIMSSTAPMPSTEAAKLPAKKRGRPPRTPKEPSTPIFPSLGTSTMSSSQAGTASSAATIPPTEEVKLPTKKRGRPPSTHKEPSTGTIPVSNAIQAIPKKRGRPPREKNESPSKSITNTSKKQKKRVKDRHQPYKPTDAELAHLEIPSYRLDPEDGRLFWTLPDGAEPVYLPHPGRGKKYQWGFEYSNLPEDYKGDDSDAGWQRWLNAKYQDSIGYDQGSYPLGEDEDAEGEGDELDAARGLTAMDTSYDPESPSPTYDRHDGSSLPSRSLFDNETFQNAQESTNNQSMGKNSPDMNPLKEIQKPQPVAGKSRGSATAANEHGGPAPKLPRGELPQGERREETRWSRWNPKIRERECFVSRLPPPRIVPRKTAMSATG